ncbi:hypothetical protein DITRI_Ditri02bG0157200 [Diplodiscus trichospermus]
MDSVCVLSLLYLGSGIKHAGCFVRSRAIDCSGLLALVIVVSWPDGFCSKRAVFLAFSMPCDWIEVKDQGVVPLFRCNVDSGETWCRPPTGFSKCNLDAAIFSDIKATGIGMTIRESR